MDAYRFPVVVETTLAGGSAHGTASTKRLATARETGINWLFTAHAQRRSRLDVLETRTRRDLARDSMCCSYSGTMRT